MMLWFTLLWPFCSNFVTNKVDDHKRKANQSIGSEDQGLTLNHGEASRVLLILSPDPRSILFRRIIITIN